MEKLTMDNVVGFVLAMISVMCVCGKRLDTNDRNAGQSITCPYCGVVGTVPDPAKNIPGSRRSTLPGRNGPVWAKVCASATGVPAAMP